jgi:hypothetical protein
MNKHCHNETKEQTTEKPENKQRDEYVTVNDNRYYRVKNINCQYCNKTNVNGWKWQPNTIPLPHTKLIRCETCFNP